MLIPYHLFPFQPFPFNFGSLSAPKGGNGRVAVSRNLILFSSSLSSSSLSPTSQVVIHHHYQSRLGVTVSRSLAMMLSRSSFAFSCIVPWVLVGGLCYHHDNHDNHDNHVLLERLHPLSHLVVKECSRRQFDRRP